MRGGAPAERELRALVSAVESRVRWRARASALCAALAVAGLLASAIGPPWLPLQGVAGAAPALLALAGGALAAWHAFRAARPRAMTAARLCDRGAASAAVTVAWALAREPARAPAPWRAALAEQALAAWRAAGCTPAALVPVRPRAALVALALVSVLGALLLLAGAHVPGPQAAQPPVELSREPRRTSPGAWPGAQDARRRAQDARRRAREGGSPDDASLPGQARTGAAIATAPAGVAGPGASSPAGAASGRAPGHADARAAAGAEGTPPIGAVADRAVSNAAPGDGTGAVDPGEGRGADGLTRPAPESPGAAAAEPSSIPDARERALERLTRETPPPAGTEPPGPPRRAERAGPDGARDEGSAPGVRPERESARQPDPDGVASAAPDREGRGRRAPEAAGERAARAAEFERGARGQSPGGDGVGSTAGGSMLGRRQRTDDAAQPAQGRALPLSDGGGDRRAETVEVGATRGFTGPAYAATYTEYARVMEATLERDAVPPGRRPLVKRYFELIRPRDHR